MLDENQIENVYLKFPIPIPEFSHNYLTLKIIPTPETKPALTKEFFNKLQTINLPLVLELIATSNTIYYQLSFAPQHEELINRQLKICFPKFIIEPLLVERNLTPQRLALPAPAEPEKPLPKHLERLKALTYDKNKPLPDILTRTSGPKFSISKEAHLEDIQALKKNSFSTPTLDRYLPVKPKVIEPETKPEGIYTKSLWPATFTQYFPLGNEFAIDPYAQLFNLFENLEQNDYAAIQFVLLPVPGEAMSQMLEKFLEVTAADPENYRIWEEEIFEEQYNHYKYFSYITHYHPEKDDAELDSLRTETIEYKGTSEIEEIQKRIKEYEIEKRGAAKRRDKYWVWWCEENIKYNLEKLKQYPEKYTRFYATFKRMWDTPKTLRKIYYNRLNERKPAWLLAVNLFSSHKYLADQILEHFFYSFTRNHAQQWACSDTVLTTTTTPYVSNWNLVRVDELATLAHFPISQPLCDKVELTTMQGNKPPELYLSNGIVIGQAKIRNEVKQICLPDEFRKRHFAIFGRSGTGKSTLIANCFRQDAEAGTAIAVIDPHGDLAQEVLDHIPPSRVNDVIYINPADSDYPIGFDLMSAKGDLEISTYTDDLLTTINRFGTPLGNRMETVLKFVFHTLLRVKGSTLMDVEKVLTNEEFRKKLLSKVDNERVLEFWRSEFPQESKDTIAALRNRFSSLSLTPPLSNLLSQRESKFNFYDSIESKKIVIFDFAKGRIGQNTSNLLGSMVVSQYQLAIQRRVAIPEPQRHLFALYIDEFQTVTNPAFGVVMNEARKFGLGVTLATQFPSLISDAIRRPIIGNTGTFIFLQLDSNDAQALRYELGNFTPEDVVNLEAVKYQAICKPVTKAKDAFIMQTAPPKQRTNFRSIVIEQSRANYSTPRVALAAPPTPPEAPTVALEPPPTTSNPTSLPFKAKDLAPALTKNLTAKDKILYYVEQAGYLSNVQIAELCYSHHKNLESKKAAASRDLNQLVKSNRLKSQPFSTAIIYYTSRLCSPTKHNLLVRDVYVSIVLSGFEIIETLFAPDLKNFIPDLQINFLANDNDQIKTFWEFDAGTEEAPELKKKLKNYESCRDDSLIVFVFDSEKRMLQMEKLLPPVDYIYITYLGKFASLKDEGFRRLKNPAWVSLIERDT
jgi:Helicase HerA, central domain